MQSSSTFGRRLRALRMTVGMSQVELARRVGRHQTAIGPYERDEYEPPRDVVEKLALVLETSPEYPVFRPQPAANGVAGNRPARPSAGMLETEPEGVMELDQLARRAVPRLPRAGRQHGARVPAGSDRAGARDHHPGTRPGDRPRYALVEWSMAAVCCGADAQCRAERYDLAAYNAPLPTHGSGEVG